MVQRRIMVAIAFVGFAMLPLRAQESSQGRPFSRVRLEPGPRVIVGQPVTVVVEVLVPTWFTGAPRFPSLDVADAIAIFEDRGVNFTERIGNETWAGQSRSYHVYPQRAGEFAIDAIPVHVRYKAPDTGTRGSITVSPPPIRFEASVPPEAAELPYFISTTELRIEHEFDREPDTLQVGDAFTRTITITVKDALSMVVPPLPATPMQGVAVYPDPPRVSDEGGARGERIVGTRVERSTFVVEKEGDYVLPAIDLAWWDIGASRVRTASLPAVPFHVDSSPDTVADIPLPAEDLIDEETDPAAGARISVIDLLRRWSIPIAAAALISLALSWLWRRYASVVQRRLVEARRRRRESEAACFARFREAARRGDPVATWNRWSAWLDRIHRGPGVPTIRAFVEAAGDSDLVAETDSLDGLLFVGHRGDRVDWSGGSLYRKVARIRRRRGRAEPGGAGGQFVSLNPDQKSGRWS